MLRSPDLAGRVLDGRYELLELIGEGTFGRVYRARDLGLERAVAVKVIKPWWAEDPVWLERFAREARTLARMSHEGTLRLMSLVGIASALACLAVPAVRELARPEEGGGARDALDLARADE